MKTLVTKVPPRRKLSVVVKTRSGRSISAQTDELDDALTSSLMKIAHSEPKKEISVVETSKVSTFGQRKSSFWFTLDEPEAERRAKLKPKVLPRIDTEITERESTYKKEATPLIRDKIEMIREFFLKELAPITMSIAGGALQAKQIVERLTESPVDGTLTANFEQMAARAARIRTAKFVQKLFDLDDYEDLIPKLQGNNQSEMAQVIKLIQQMNENLGKQISQIKIGPKGELRTGSRKQV